uniref:glutamate receptor 1.3-like n=1 Tax=Erigeron canadensis TaxID=72917 RepID=UPI001CB94143|nr:glutamate receptor 1.3-like [Erigeron canadensis]
MLSSKSKLWIILFFCILNNGFCAYIVDVGVVFDMESSVGKSIHGCIMMALSDFYARHGDYRTRIVVHTSDHKGDPLQAMSNVVDLLNTVKVNAIIGPEIYIGSKQLALVADKATVPIYSFAGRSLMEYPYLLQIKEDDVAMAKSIAALVESYTWRDVIFLYEDADQGPEMLHYLLESFQDKSIRITYRYSISKSATNDQVLKDLNKLMKVHTSVIIVHMSPLLASRLFVNAKILGMMSEGYAWILTQKTSESMHSTEFEVLESVQGALAFRSYVPMSRRLHNLAKRWRNEFSGEVPLVAIWAYDTIWALAESFERVGLQRNGYMLLNETLKIELKGVSGQFRLSQRKLVSNGFEIINAVDYGERKVGYWTLSNGIRRAHLPFNNNVLHSTNCLEEVIWPRGSKTTPKGWILRTNLGKKLRIGVRTGLKFKYFVDAQYDAKKNTTNATGFSVDVFNSCIHELSYEVPYELVPYEKGSYDILINKVYTKELDGVLGDSTILANRSAYVDFTATYTDVGIGTLTRIKERDFWIFLEPLDKKLWLTFAGFAILTGFTIWAIEVMDQDSESSSSQQVGAIFWLILLALFSAQREKLSNNLSRCMLFLWLIVVLVLITGYTATLTSFLTVEQFELASKGGTVGFHGGSLMTISNLKFKDCREKQYYSYDDYADSLLKGGKHGGADAIVDEIPYIKMFLARYSAEDYAMVSSQPVSSGFGFIFAKGSPLVADMSREIAKLRENGTLINLEKKWFVNENSLLNKDSFTEPKPLNLIRFGGLFIVIGISSALALIISIGYKVRAKMEVESIISFLAGRKLMTTIRYLLYRNIT